MKFSNPKLSLFLAVFLCVILAVVVTFFSVRVSWDPYNRTVAQILIADYPSLDDGQFINIEAEGRIDPVDCVRRINCRSPKASLKFANDSVNIGTIAAGSRVSKAVSVAYTGSANATNVAFTTAAPFSVMSTTCGTQTRANCTVTIGYIPTTIASTGQSGTLTMTYHNGSYTETKTMALTGKGLTNDFSKVLLVYNTNSTDSVALKDYYLQNRPGVAPINTLGIATTVGENIPLADFESTIRTPIMNWMTANSSKGVKYIILVRDVPSRISGFSNNTPYQTVRSVQTRLESAKKDLYLIPFSASSFELYSPQPYNPTTYPGTLALITHLDTGSLASTKTYIDKLAMVHAKMATPNAIISGKDANILGTTYYCEDSANIFGGTMTVAAGRCSGIQNEFPAIPVQIRTYTQPYFTQASDVRGFVTWGQNGRNRSGNYATNGELAFSGKSNWFLLLTAESYNGISHASQPSWQGNFEDWHSANAFGGTNYSNTPAASVGHTFEPGLGGVNSYNYFTDWEKGNLFIDVAWGSRTTPVFRATGDPLIKQ